MKVKSNRLYHIYLSRMKLKKMLIALTVIFSCFANTAAAQEVVAEVGGVGYTDIYEAFEEADGFTVTILKDLELNKKIIVSNYANIVVEGEGRTIRFVGSGYGFIVKSKANVTFGSGLNIVAANGVRPLYIQDGIVTTSANFSTETGNVYAPIMSVADRTGDLTINGGNIVAGSDAAAAIYWPCSGSLVINNGYLEGASALYFKSGNLEINNGTFVGKGPVKPYEHVEDGYIPTGAAVVVENVGDDLETYPKVRAVEFNGGTYSSANTVAVQSETAGYPDVLAKTEFIHAGTYSSDVSSLVAYGYRAEANGDGTYTVVRDNSIVFEAQIGGTPYATLTDALVAVKAGETVKLLEDITLGAKIQLQKNNVTIDLNGRTVTANCQKAFEVFGNNVAFINGKIFAMQRCIDTRKNVNITLSNLVLETTSTAYGNPQPITIGGSLHGTVVNMNNVSIDFPVGSGYAVIAFVKTDLTATNCTFNNAFGALYFKEPTAGIPTGSAGSSITLNNCFFYAQSGVTGESNYFSLIVLRANDITVTVNGGLLKGVGQVSAFNLHGYDTYTGGTAYAEGCTIKVSADTEIEGDLIKPSKENFAENTIVLPATEEYKESLKEQDFYIQDNGDGTVTPVKDVVFVDGDFAYTNDADLEKMQISYQRTFPKHSVWVSVFFPFEIPVSMLLDNYQVAEWTGILYEKNGAGEVTSCGIELTKIKNPADTLKANYPYLIYPKDDAARNFEIVLEDATLYGANEANLLTLTSEVMTCSMKGNYRTMQKAELADGWVVGSSGNWVRSAGSMKPFRLFLTREWADDVQVNLSSTAMRFVFRDSDGFTAIENPELNVIQEDVVFDLQGRRVVNPTKGGIYIVNGKKVFKK